MVSGHIPSPDNKAWSWMTCVSGEFADLEVAVIFLTAFLHGWQALHLTLLGPTELAAGAVLLMDCQPGDSLITTLCFSLMESSDSQGQEVNWNRCYFRNCMMPRNHIFASLSLFSGFGLRDLSCFSHTELLFFFWITPNNGNLYKYNKTSSLYQAFFPLGMQAIWAEARCN